MTLESITTYCLGYFPEGQKAIKALLHFAQLQGVLSKDFLDTHILSEGKTGQYSPFEGRILFPIKDHLGRVCGFGGRIFKPSDTRSKYYNSRENDFFIKGSLLFNFDRAKTTIQETEIAFLVEGYTDCIGMTQAGFANTVATLGTACTAQHLKLLSRYAHTVYVIYDSDVAGHDAVLRLVTLCWQVSMELKIVTLPPGLDPAAFITSGGDMRAAIARAQDICLFYLKDIGAAFATQPLAKKIEGLKGLIDAIAAVESPLKQDLLIQEASHSLNIQFDILKSELLRVQTNKNYESQKSAKKPSTQPINKTSTLQKLEKLLICAILNNAVVLNEQNVRYLKDYLPEPFGRIVYQLYHVAQHTSEHHFRFLLASLDMEQQALVTGLVFESQVELRGEQFTVLYERWWRQQWKVVVADIRLKLTQAANEGDQEQVALLLKEFTALKQEMVLHVSGVYKER
jgi:DNA primase